MLRTTAVVTVLAISSKGTGEDQRIYTDSRGLLNLVECLGVAKPSFAEHHMVHNIACNLALTLA